ncbi:MAG: bifunctional phosphoserine phosphatase/homoserine phosphotransferase ThrH [Pseudomonadota bacterium]|nr:bifunctional phosphoserine phosphatase/homoserine phosphotransferase ThrH [Pseudomonadota bacterium]
MEVLCLDLEGVLVPEIWQAVAARTGLQALEKTTRDIPVYDDLMKYRLQILDEYDIHLSLIQEEIAKLEPLQGAVEFLHWARLRFQVAIVSDTFYEFGMPLMQSLGYPQLLCHTLEVKDDRVVGYTLRQEDPKRQVVKAFKSLKYTVFAAGDSFNDVNMLEEADQGFFYCAPENVVAQFPQFPCTESYAQLQERLSGVG